MFTLISLDVQTYLVEGMHQGAKGKGGIQCLILSLTGNRGWQPELKK